jgi:hypothetical protein
MVGGAHGLPLALVPTCWFHSLTHAACQPLEASDFGISDLIQHPVTHEFNETQRRQLTFPGSCT